MNESNLRLVRNKKKKKRKKKSMIWILCTNSLSVSLAPAGLSYSNAKLKLPSKVSPIFNILSTSLFTLNSTWMSLKIETIISWMPYYEQNSKNERTSKTNE